jgi:adenylylsulfate kinase
MARRIARDVPFLEVFIDTPLQVCEARDQKGLYHQARAGKISNFTGISAPYEAPAAPDLVVSTEGCTIEQSATSLIPELIRTSAVSAPKVQDLRSHVHEVPVAFKAA